MAIWVGVSEDDTGLDVLLHVHVNHSNILVLLLLSLSLYKKTEL
jgi:hypothetical protein